MPTYIDLDLSFYRHPGTGDVFKKYDVDAVKFAIKNIILSNIYDKPFNPDFSVNLRAALFELQGVAVQNLLKRQISNLILQYESRCILDDIILTENNNSLTIEVQFHAVGYVNQQTLNIVVERTR